MILVTGANGYVARYTIQHLIAKGEQVRALVRNEGQFAKLSGVGVTAVKGDVTDAASLEAAMQDVAQVIHLAAVNRDRGNSTMQAVNAQGTINVVDAARNAGVGHIVTFVGLGADARRPYPLARTQGIGVEYLMRSGIPYTILEASVVFGEGDEFLNTLAGLARIPPFMIVPGNGKTRFQPISVQDVAACIVGSLGNTQAISKRLQICGSEVLSLEAIIDAILAEMKLKRVKIHIPVGILKPAVLIMDKILPKPPVTPSLLAMLGVDNVATDNVTESVFGIRPEKLSEGIGYVNNMRLSTLIKRSLGIVNNRQVMLPSLHL